METSKEEKIKKLIEETNKIDDEISYYDGKRLELEMKKSVILDELHELGVEVF